MKLAKKNIMVIILALMLIGSTSVLAAMTYSFSMDNVSNTAYSRVFTKTASTSYAYFKQTGSSGGTYTVIYTVVTDSIPMAEATGSLEVAGTDRDSHRLLYNTTYRNQTQVNMKLRGRYNGRSEATVAGEWNPVD